MNENPTQQNSTQPLDDVQLGQKLREAREYIGLSQEEVAEHLQIPRASISALESGKRKVSALELDQFAQLYKRPISFFYEKEAMVEDPRDETMQALFRTTAALSPKDRQQLLLFAKFLRQMERPLIPTDERTKLSEDKAESS